MGLVREAAYIPRSLRPTSVLLSNPANPLFIGHETLWLKSLCAMWARMKIYHMSKPHLGNGKATLLISRDSSNQRRWLRESLFDLRLENAEAQECNTQVHLNIGKAPQFGKCRGRRRVAEVLQH
jgi:hypothetical protein